MSINRCLLLTAACVAAGCGPRSISVPATVPVSGRVLFKGKALGGVRVKLYPKFDMGTVKFTPSGETNREGKFSISTGAAGDGAPPGDYAILFEFPRAASDQRGLDIEVDVWKGKHADPKGGKFQAYVAAGKEDLGTFQLD